MEIISQTTEFTIKERTAIAIGKFDGIHKGHQRLLQEIFEAKSLKAAVFTFDPSPTFFLKGSSIRELMTKEEKRAQFAGMGVDYLVEYPFNRESASVLPEDYVNQFLVKKMHAALIAAGEDVTFGYRGAGDAKLLRKLAKEKGIEVSIIPKLSYNGREISSTYVREAVQEGNMELAALLMGQPFFVQGIVAHGNQIGRTIGMPTVNVHPDKTKLMPPNGVYCATVHLSPDGEDGRSGRVFRGVTNVGFKPTVQQDKRLGVETFLFDFDEDLYDRKITVFLHHFLRPEMKFDGLAALKEAISGDVSAAKRFFGQE